MDAVEVAFKAVRFVRREIALQAAANANAGQ